MASYPMDPSRGAPILHDAKTPMVSDLKTSRSFELVAWQVIPVNQRREVFLGKEVMVGRGWYPGPS